MALLYIPGFDFGIIGTASCTLTDTSGGPYAISFTSGTYAHSSMESITGTGTYTSFATAFKAALDGTASPRVYTVSVSTTTLKYTITNDDSSSFTLTFAATTAATLLRRILGLSATTAGTSIVSDQRPYYVIAAMQGATAFGSVNTGGRSVYSDDYEPDGIASMAVADSGATYLISRTAAPVYAEWVQAMETYENVHAHKATSTVPWTYDHFFAHVRNGNMPFAVSDTTMSPSTFEVYRLRADGAAFHPTREVADVNTLWRIPFRAVLVGRT